MNLQQKKYAISRVLATLSVALQDIAREDSDLVAKFLPKETKALTQQQVATAIRRGDLKMRPDKEIRNDLSCGNNSYLHNFYPIEEYLSAHRSKNLQTHAMCKAGLTIDADTYGYYHGPEFEVQERYQLTELNPKRGAMGSLHVHIHSTKLMARAQKIVDVYQETCDAIMLGKESEALQAIKDLESTKF